MHNKTDKASTVPGFTLLEVIVVLAVLTVLAGIAVPVVGATLRIADTSATTEEMDAIRQAILNFYEDVAQMPSSLDDLVEAPPSVDGWLGPYINVGLTSEANNDFRHDAWRRAYELISAGDSRLTLRSWGPDRSDDSGSDDDIDLAVDVTPVQRKLTQQRLDAINAAIISYNRYFRFTTNPGGQIQDHPLSGPWGNTRTKLVNADLLPNDLIYLTDAWGNAFACGPDPVQYVTSLGPQ